MTIDMQYICPVCGYPKLTGPPVDFLICPCCGTEFEYDDATLTHQQLRHQWIQSGMQWHSHAVSPSPGWNAWWQLIKARFEGDLPSLPVDLRPQMDVVQEPPLTLKGFKSDYRVKVLA